MKIYAFDDILLFFGLFYSFLFIIVLFNEFKLFNTYYLTLNNILLSLNKIA
jgi:hypothetical protein